MKVSVNAGELAGALALAASLSSDSRHARKIAALEAVHVKPADGAVIIGANVLDHALELTLPAVVEAPGEVAVSSSRLAALAAGFPQGATIGIASDGNVARVTSGRSRFRLPTIPLDTLCPAPTITEEAGHVDLAREETIALLRPIFAMAREAARYYLCGVLLCDAADGLAAVATDGKRIARAAVPGVWGLSQDHHLIVPAPAIKIVGRLLGDKSVERVTLRCSETLLAVEGAQFVFTSKLVDGTFPDYTRILPQPCGNSITVERAELLQALERLAAVAEEEHRRVAGLQWAADEPALLLCLRDTDTANDAVAAEVTGSGRVAVSIDHVAELLEVFGGTRVRFDSRSGADPILITDPDDEDFLVVQMPHMWELTQAA